jgi:hypothetical protein
MNPPFFTGKKPPKEVFPHSRPGTSPKRRFCQLPQVSAAGSVHFQEDGVTGVLRWEHGDHFSRNGEILGIVLGKVVTYWDVPRKYGEIFWFS